MHLLRLSFHCIRSTAKQKHKKNFISEEWFTAGLSDLSLNPQLVFISSLEILQNCLRTGWLKVW